MGKLAKHNSSSTNALRRPASATLHTKKTEVYTFFSFINWMSIWKVTAQLHPYFRLV